MKRPTPTTKPAKRKVKQPDRGKRVRELARERVGAVKPTRPIDESKPKRRPKHKRPPTTEDE